MESIAEEFHRYFVFVSNQKSNSLETASRLNVIAKRCIELLSQNNSNDISASTQGLAEEFKKELQKSEIIYKNYVNSINNNLKGEHLYLIELNNLIFNCLEPIINQKLIL